MSIYLDSAATTPLHSKVIAEMNSVIDTFGNTGSKHYEGVRAKKKMEEYLEKIAKIMGISRDQIVVTHGGTDANRKVLWAMRKRILHENMWCSSVEHSSIGDEILDTNKFNPFTFQKIPNNAQFLALMQANNETGSIFDIEKLRKKFPQALILSDCVQSIGKTDLNLKNCDFATISAHKFHGPKGVGILYVRHPENFKDLSKDSHTKDLTTVAGMSKAFELLSIKTQKKLKNWSQQIEKFIEKNISNYKIHGLDTSRVPGIISVAFKNIRGSELMMTLSEKEQICISTGAACTSDIFAPTTVMQAIETNPEWQYPIRIGLHSFLAEKDINEFCEILAHYVEELRQ